MKFQAFKIFFLAVALAIPSKHGALASKNSRCLESQCLTDAISCLADDAGTPVANLSSLGISKKTVQETKLTRGRISRLAKLEKEIASLKAQLAKAGKPSGFAMLDSNGRLPQNLLLAGYDKYSAYDLAWQSLHMAAAAACRGSTASGGSGKWANSVRVSNIPGKKTCAQICLDSGHFRHCDAEVSIYGVKGKATKKGQGVGAFYNHRVNVAWGNGGTEASVSNEAVRNYDHTYFSFCCCRN